MQIIYLHVGNREIPIYPEDIFLETNGICILELQPANENMPLVLGDTFLRTVAAIFDIDGLRIGMAQRPDHVSRLNTTLRRLQNRSLAPQKPLPAGDPWWADLPLGWLVAGAVLLGSGIGCVVGILVGFLLQQCVRHFRRPARAYVVPEPHAAGMYTRMDTP